MLTAQAHTFDGLFASEDFEQQERFMKLAFRAQNQAQATLQTLRKRGLAVPVFHPFYPSRLLT